MLKTDKSLDRGNALVEVRETDRRVDEAARRPFAPPGIVCHDELPVITAGSISQEAWGFESD